MNALSVIGLVFGGILALLGCLMLLPVYFRVCYCDTLSLSLQVGFIKKTFRLGRKEIPAHDETPPPERAKKPSPPKKTADIKEFLIILKETVGDLYTGVKKHIRLKTFTLKLNVGGEDPAKTAIYYGVISGAAAGVWRLANEINDSSGGKAKIDFEVKPDFIAESTDVYADIILGTYVWRTVLILSKLLKGYNRFKEIST
ncbi:MAG: DUF2953 domain-containing protein [Eubacteriales bacterium]